MLFFGAPVPSESLGGVRGMAVGGFFSLSGGLEPDGEASLRRRVVACFRWFRPFDCETASRAVGAFLLLSASHSRWFTPGKGSLASKLKAQL